MSDPPYLCYRELLASTTVSHATFFQCGGNAELFLLVGTASSISVYGVVKNELKSDLESDEVFLVYYNQYNLFGKLHDVQVVGKKGSKSQLIFLTFDVAKFVLLSYDPFTQQLNELCILNGEENASGPGSEVKGCGYGSILHQEPISRVDNFNYAPLLCSVIYSRLLYFVPLPSWQASSLVQPFIVDPLRQLLLPGRVIDACFVPGYGEPVIAILQEDSPSPVGHTAHSRHHCSLSLLAVNCSRKSAALLWTRKHLPSDSLRLLALKNDSVKGILAVVSLSAIVILNEFVSGAIATNSFASITVHPCFKIQSPNSLPLGFNLDGSHWIECGNLCLAGCLRSGEILFLQMTPTQTNALTSFKLELNVIAKTVSNCSCLVSSESNDFWFVGSRQTDSVLMKARFTIPSSDIIDDVLTQSNDATSTFLTPVVPQSQKRKRSSKFSNILETPVIVKTQEMADEELLLYGQVLPPALSLPVATAKACSNVSLSVVDVIPTLGPVSCGAFTEAESEDWYDFVNEEGMKVLDWSSFRRQRRGVQHSKSSALKPQEAKDCLTLATGIESEGTLNRLSVGLRLSKLISKELVGVTSVMNLEFSTLPNGNSSEELIHNFNSFLVASFEDATRVFKASKLSNSINSSNCSLTEIETSYLGFVDNCSTVAVGIVHVSSRVVVQITPHGLRLNRFPNVENVGDFENDVEVEALQDMPVSDSEEAGGLGRNEDDKIVQAEVREGYVLLLTRSRTLLLLHFEPQQDSLVIVHVAETTEGNFLSQMKERNEMNEEEDSVNISPLSRHLTKNVVSVRFFHGNFNMDGSEKPKDDFKEANMSPGFDFDSLSPGRGNFSPQSKNSLVIPNNDNDLVSASVLAEEIFLYGKSLQELSFEESTLSGNESRSLELATDFKTPMKQSSILSVLENEKISMDESNEVEDLYIVIADSLGTVSLVKVNDLTQVVSTNISSSNPHIDFCSSSASHLLSFPSSSPLIQKFDLHNKHEKLDNEVDLVLCDVKIFNLEEGKMNSSQIRTSNLYNQNSLCLVGIFSNGSTVIYHNNNNKNRCRNKYQSRFLKVEHNVVTHRSMRQNQIKFSSIRDDPKIFDQINTFRLNSISSICNSNGIIIPGSNPAVVLSNLGRPQMVSLNFPELPHANDGYFLLSSMRLGESFSLVSLWFEFNIGSEVLVPKRSVGVYSLPTSTSFFPGGLLTSSRIEVGQTINFCSELLPRSDDKIEAALLSKKTFVLACSTNVQSPFIPSVLTNEQVKIEEESYDRFFPKLDSFAQPDERLAPSPLLNSSQHKLVLIQSGSVVDEFLLKEGERVSGLEVLYVSVEKFIEPVLTLQQMLAIPFIKPPPIQTTIGRVLLAVSTLCEDLHGEDTQGEGRLLLFSLDYKLFENEEKDKEGDKVEGDKVKEEKENGKTDGSIENGSDESMSLKVLSTAESTAQSNFLGSILPKLKLRWTGTGPATAVKQMGPHLVTTIGYCVYIYKINLDTMEMDQIGFHFARFYIANFSIVKNYIILSDTCNSVQFLVWREEDVSLTLLAKDYDSHICISSGFIFDNGNLGIVVADSESNIQIFQFNPRKPESIEGSRLLTLADFHLGSDANILLSHTMLASPLYNFQQQQLLINGNNSTSTVLSPSIIQSVSPFGCFLDKYSQRNSKTCLLTGTMDGGVGLIFPVEEKTYRSLSLLQQLMSMGVKSTCCLNQKDFRLIKTSSIRLEKKRGVLDGVLLWKFVSLPRELQNDLAAVIGTNAEHILETLAKLDTMISFF